MHLYDENKPSQVRERFNLNAARMCISSITLMELIFGAEKSQFPELNLGKVERFVAQFPVMDYNAQAAAHTGHIRAELVRKGTPAGPYDQMIAGHAHSLGLVVVTNNLREFQRIPGILTDDWI